MQPSLRLLTLPVAPELLEKIREFDCVPENDPDDVVAREVCEFIREEEYEPGMTQGFNTTYLLMDDDTAELLGYLTLGVDFVRLSGGERDRLVPGAPKPTFGAVRIVMIGIDNAYARQGLGSQLLDAAIGIARQVASNVAFRFITADVNVKKKDWYADRGFEVNRSPDEAAHGDGSTISMRFDLKRSDELTP